MKSLKIYRTDLNLKNYWWHRFLIVLFIVSFIIVVFVNINGLYENYQLPKYTRVGSLATRMDSKLRLIGTLIQPKEKIAVYEHNLYGSYNNKSNYAGNGGWLLKQEYYCANNIANHVDEVVAITGVNYFKGNLDLISLEEFKDYLTQNKANCIQILDLDPNGYYKNVDKTLTWGLEADNMSVFKISPIKSVFAVVQTLFYVSVVFLILIVLYYKVFLYIVFGNTDNKTHS